MTEPNLNKCPHCGQVIERKRDLPRHQMSQKCLSTRAPVVPEAPEIPRASQDT